MSDIIPEEPLALQAPPPAPRAPWGLRDMVLAGAALLAVLLAVILALVIVMFMLGWTDPTRLPPTLMVAALLAQNGLFLGATWAFGPGRYKTGWASLGLRRFPAFKSLAMTALALGEILVINSVWSLVQQRFDLAPQPSMLPWFGGGVGGLALAMLLGGGLVGFAEESFFRGFLYAGLRARWGVGWAAVISSAIFAALHLLPSVILPVFVMGMLFCWLYERTGSLWPGIALHATVNSLAFFGAYLLERYPGLANGGV